MGQVSVLKDENRDSEALKLKKGDISYLSYAKCLPFLPWRQDG